ncbi:hypothetical protein [Actinomadura litoris]|uniref:hypothetical protein n=1 Tax=Actinomadura litoris TaxID=2678616 RepID=UPI001FA78E95|nr:hypothetical protein [Actinomadura litoris]
MHVKWDPQWVAIFVSIAFSLAAFVVSARGLKWQRASAEAAIKSANADEQSAALALLQHQLAEARLAQAETGEPAPPVVEWRLERTGKNRFVLRNVGSDMATGVTIDASQVATINRELPDGAAIRPGGSHSFLMLGTFGAPVPDEIWVTWDGHPEPVALPVPPAP